MKIYYVYILTDKKDQAIITGITSDLERTLFEIKNSPEQEIHPQNNIDKVVYIEKTRGIIKAIDREKIIASWNKEKIFNLIKKENPNFEEICV